MALTHPPATDPLLRVTQRLAELAELLEAHEGRLCADQAAPATVAAELRRLADTARAFAYRSWVTYSEVMTAQLSTERAMRSLDELLGTDR